MSNPKGPVTLADVARMAGVSKMTVSNVLNDRPGMSERTRARVLEAIERSGYVVNTAARALSGRRASLIGIIAPRFGWPYVTEIIHGAGAEAEADGLDLAIFTTSENPRVERERAALLRTIATGVLLILPAADEHEVFGDAVPVITINAAGPHTIAADNHQGGRLAAEHLLALGHRRIAHVHGPENTAILRDDARERREGFLAALHAAGISVPAAYLADGDFSEDGGERAARAVLTRPEPPTAIFAANDNSALGVLRAARALGVRVPEDLSVVGFDDVPLAAATRPALTTVRQPLREMGAAATRTLLDLARGIEPPDAHPRLPMTLIVRESTARAPEEVRLP